MESHDLDRAIRTLCSRFQWHGPVEILMIGGAAGMLTGLLPKDRTTTDCDIIRYSPNSACARVEQLAEEIGNEMELPERWLNSDIAVRSDLIPDGWESRRVLIDRGDILSVYAISRVDLIAMKFFAGRVQDKEDLQALQVRADDIEFARAYLEALLSKGTPADKVAEALELLETWLE